MHAANTRAGFDARAWSLPAFAATLFLSALLLFAVQPMFTKMVLPHLGGSPGVWSVAMVVFQGLLLLGYVWAHLLARWLPPPAAALLHLAVCALASLCLPIAASVGAPAEGGQALWLVGLFAAGIGLPFFALAANGPLLQAWFARTGHPAAADPYFLYGASNLGSFAALLAYPFLLEPLLGLADQSRLWSAGFGLLVLGLAVCAGLTGLGRPSLPAPNRLAGAAVAAPRLGDYGAWIGLALIPSGLLVSVTAHISTDVGAAPLLWVIPLALFLLTFVLAFRERPPLRDAAAGCLHVWLVVLALVSVAMGSRPIASSFAISLAAFFVAALVCHRGLYGRRPAHQHLTAFYVCMSLGGVLGGLFAGLVAPAIFSNLYEYPALLAASLLGRPGAVAALRATSRRAWGVFGALLAAGLLLALAAATTGVGGGTVRLGLTFAFAVGAVSLWRDASRAFGMAALCALAATLLSGLLTHSETHRSFFGVHKVKELFAGEVRVLMHGTTVHGAMRLRAADGTPVEGRPRPTTYYTFEGPMGEAIRSVRRARGGRLGHIGAIGLGVGSLACHPEPGEAITFYEIDPLVVRLARDPNLFRYLSDCAPAAPIVLGDARLTLAGQREHSDVIVVDAFSSDAIPTHLLTREAAALFRSRLRPEGVLLFHVSNHVMDFTGVLARIAAELGLVALYADDGGSFPDHPDLRLASSVVALVRDPAHLGGPALASGRWSRLQADPTTRVWTDDYSTILTTMLAKLRER